MAQQQLDGTDVGAGFKQMDREYIVAQRMGRDGFGNATPAVRLLARLLHGAPRDGMVRPSARKSQCRDRLTRHHSRKIASGFGESIT